MFKQDIRGVRQNDRMLTPAFKDFPTCRESFRGLVNKGISMNYLRKYRSNNVFFSTLL